MAPALKVLLVEDHAMVREGLRALLQVVVDMEPLAGTGDAAQVLSLVAQLRPDVVVMDIGLGDANGIELTRTLREQHPTIGVVMLTMYDDAATVDRALRAGARGYVLKGGGIEDLCAAIRTVAGGGTHLDRGVSEALLTGLLRNGAELDPLTERERSIIGLIAEGYTSAEVAESLRLRTKTVQNYRSQIMDKLGVHTTAGLVRYAIRAGLCR